MDNAVKTIDLHGKNVYQAKIMIDSERRRGAKTLYRLRVIHGHTNGTAIKEMIFSEYKAGGRIKRLVAMNDSVTDIVLREL